MNAVKEAGKSRIYIDEMVDIGDKAKIMAASKKSSPPRPFGKWAINTLLSVSESSMNDGFRVVEATGGVFISSGDFHIRVDASVQKAQAFADYLNVLVDRAK